MATNRNTKNLVFLIIFILLTSCVPYPSYTTLSGKVITTVYNEKDSVFVGDTIWVRSVIHPEDVGNWDRFSKARRVLSNIVIMDTSLCLNRPISCYDYYIPYVHIIKGKEWGYRSPALYTEYEYSENDNTYIYDMGFIVHSAGEYILGGLIPENGEPTEPWGICVQFITNKKHPFLIGTVNGVFSNNGRGTYPIKVYERK